MNNNSLQRKAAKGVAWSAIERFSVQGVNFLIQLILARLLLPSDYGLVGMLSIFINLAQIFVDSGFANALIQKKNCTNKDYSTVFLYNFVIALVLYAILFFCAPAISNFYNEPKLINVTRVISLTLVINAISIIQRTKLIKSLDFKSQAKVSVSSATLSGVLGIVLAYKGFGVWSLCFQQIANGVLQAIFYLVLVKWFPLLVFDKTSFKELFNFGYKLVLVNLINAIYKNLYTIVIGKKFTPEKVGLYAKAEQFVVFPSGNLGSLIIRVIYPLLSEVQNDEGKLKSVYRNAIKLSSYIIFPLMFGLLAITKPFISVVLTDKWLSMAPIMQILCLDWMLDHISMINLNLLMVKGRTDLSLRLEIIKKIIAISILACSIPFGIIVMCWGRVLYSVIATYLNTRYTKLLIGLSLRNQLHDILPYFISSLIMALSVLFFNEFIAFSWAQLIVGIIVGVLVYLFISFCFFRDTLKKIISMKPW